MGDLEEPNRQAGKSQDTVSRKFYNALQGSYCGMNRSTSRLMLIVKVIGETLFLFGLLAWLNGVVIQFTHPDWLPLPVSHLLNVRTDTFTIIMFFVSAFGFFVWRLMAELLKSEQNKPAQ